MTYSPVYNMNRWSGVIILYCLWLVCRICLFYGLVRLREAYSVHIYPVKLGLILEQCKFFDDHACIIDSEYQNSQYASTWSCARPYDIWSAVSLSGLFDLYIVCVRICLTSLKLNA
jgi:hypothetical protein